MVESEDSRVANLATEPIEEAELIVKYATALIGAISRDSAVSDRDAAGVSIVCNRVIYAATARLGGIVRDGAVCDSDSTCVIKYAATAARGSFSSRTI